MEPYVGRPHQPTKLNSTIIVHEDELVVVSRNNIRLPIPELRQQTTSMVVMRGPMQVSPTYTTDFDDSHIDRLKHLLEHIEHKTDAYDRMWVGNARRWKDNDRK